MKLLLRIINRITLLLHFILVNFVTEEKLLGWKPIHICEWFNNNDTPIPKYFIGATTRTQVTSRWRNDDGSETTATWAAAANTDITPIIRDSNLKLRLRINVRQTGTTAATYTGTLYVSKNGGAYAQISATATNGCKPVDSANFADNDTTTQQLSAGTFVAGRMDEVNGQSTATGLMAQNVNTEHEWMLQFTSSELANGDYFDFRQRHISSNLNTYTVTPRITITLDVPIVVLNSPADAGTAAPLTPDLVFTGTDINGNAIEYEVQIDTVNTFSSGSPNFDSTINGAYFLPAASTHNTVIGGSSTTLNQVQACGQSISLTSALVAKGIKMEFKKNVSPTDTLTIELLSGSITGTIIASGTISASSVSTSDTVYSITFSSPVSLSASTTYYIRCTRTPDSENATSFISIVGRGTTGNYVPGVLQYKYNNAWQTDGGDDLYFNLIESPPIIDKLSVTPDATFTDITNGADTHPFASGDQVKYTVQAGDILTASTLYYWRARGKAPSGTNTYGAWSTTRSFTALLTNIKTILGLAKASVKTINGLAIASIKSRNGLT